MGRAAAARNIPIASEVLRQPGRPGASGSMAKASSGTSTIPPTRKPSIARAMAVERWRTNQLFSTVIIGIQVPRPTPMLITIKAA